MVKAARQERVKGRRVVVTNRELWVNGRRWRWDKVKQCWQVGRGKVELEQDEGSRPAGRERRKRDERRGGPEYERVEKRCLEGRG